MRGCCSSTATDGHTKGGRTDKLEGESEGRKDDHGGRKDYCVGPTETGEGPTETDEGPTETGEGPTETVEGPTETGEGLVKPATTKRRSDKAGCWSLCVKTATEDTKTAKEIRIEEQKNEEEQMLEAVNEFIKKIVVKRWKFFKTRKYKYVMTMQNIGSRLQKYWIEIRTKGKKRERISYVVSVSKFSTLCPIGTHEEVASKIEAVKKLFEIINAHPFIHEIKEVDVTTRKEISGGLLIVVQKKSPEGSLRDLIYSLDEGDFEKSWSKKYSAALTFKEELQPVAINYITQILKGMLYLRKIGFPVLGNVHLGNVFLTKGEDGKDKCTITGHENALFGYRTSLYQKIYEAGYVRSIDIIMLGHMLYELATCQQLQDVFPTKEQRKAITNEPVRKLLKFIFEKSDSKMKHTLDEILKKIIEKGWYTGTDDLTEEEDVTVSEDIKELLGKIQ